MRLAADQRLAAARILDLARRKAAPIAWRIIRPKVPSRTLRRDTQIVYDDAAPGLAYLWQPYYWAVYLEGGHGEIVARHKSPSIRRNPDSKRVGAKYLRFYPNERDDPRTAGGTNYPKTIEDIQYHTIEQLEEKAGKYASVRSIAAKEGAHYFSNPEVAKEVESAIGVAIESALTTELERSLPKGTQVIRLPL